jgi:tetratricopeptide (TPR) repeat protein
VEMKISYQNIMAMRQVLLIRFKSDSETQYLLGKAGYAGLRGEYENVISILSPNISKFTNRIEASEAYSLLGTAEYKLGHPQLAAGYFELMYANNPTSNNLYTLALAYDGGGNLEKALEKYALVISFQDGTIQPDKLAHAQQRIQEIMTIKGINNTSP